MEQKVEVEEEQEVEIKVEENPSVDSNTKDNATSAPEVVVSEEKPEDKEEELDDYSKRVQKRIKTLTEKYRNEEREREEATRFAATVKAENDDLKKRLANLDTGYLNEYGTRLESQLSSAKQLFKEARDAGDSEKEFEAQQALAKITVEQERYRLAKQRQEQNKVEVQKAPQQQPQQPQPQPQPQPDEKAKNWAEKNEWFGQDEIMTYAAFGLHRKLTEEEGFDAKSDEYYNEIDSRMRAEFPHKFKNSVPKNGGSTRVASADTSASRTKNTGRRTVKLSPSQIAIAKKLGVPLEEYAKYVKD
tara:strand:- start:2351 stop:3259 length:909 start_codon:yes stop_codon:yes gene_type:complete